MAKKPKVVLNEREQLIEDLTQAREAIRFFIIQSGIQVLEFNAPVKNLEKKTNDQIRALLEQTLALKNGPVKQVQDIWKLRTPNYWEGLAMFGQSNTREQKLYKSRLKDLRMAWRKRDEQDTESPEAQEASDNVSNQEGTVGVGVQPS